MKFFVLPTSNQVRARCDRNCQFYCGQKLGIDERTPDFKKKKRYAKKDPETFDE